MLLFYTDGLIERRDTDLSDRLNELVAAVAPIVPDDVCTTVMHQMIGNGVATDDIAFVAIRKDPDQSPEPRAY